MEGLTVSTEKQVFVGSFLDDVRKAEEDWEKYVQLPFCKAYDKAYELYNSKIDEQAKTDATKAELLFFALTLVGGTAFTAMFGAAAVKVAARNIAVATVIKSRNAALIRAAKMVRDTPEASFALGEVVDGISKVVSAKVKAKIAEQFPAEKALGTSFTPDQLDYSTRHSLAVARSKLVDVAHDIRDNPRFSLTDTRRLLDSLRPSPFMNPPTKPFYDAHLQDAIELIMFLNLVTTRDKLVKTQHMSNGMFPVHANLGRADITARPGDKNYPLHSRAYRPMQSYAGYTMSEEVQVSDLGSRIDSRINELYNKFFHRKLLGKTLNLNEIREAHISLTQMSQKYQLPGMLTPN